MDSNTSSPERVRKKLCNHCRNKRQTKGSRRQSHQIGRTVLPYGDGNKKVALSTTLMSARPRKPTTFLARRACCKKPHGHYSTTGDLTISTFQERGTGLRCHPWTSWTHSLSKKRKQVRCPRDNSHKEDGQPKRSPHYSIWCMLLDHNPV